MIEYVYQPGEGEYNLRNMYKETLQKAFKKHAGDKAVVEAVGKSLGVSGRQVYRMLDEYELRHLLISEPCASAAPTR